jgi:hypothetical protein
MINILRGPERKMIREQTYLPALFLVGAEEYKKAQKSDNLQM